MESVTLAAAAVLLTGKLSRRGARNASERSGPPIVWPTLATSSSADAPPTKREQAAAADRRRVGGDRGEAAGLGRLGARGAQVVAQRAHPAALAVRADDDRRLHQHVQRERGREDDRAVVVRDDEVEAERVPVLRVHDPGHELEHGARDEQRDREPLDRLRGRGDRRPREQARHHRPQLRQQERHRDQADVHVQALRDRIQPASGRPASRSSAAGRRARSRCRAGPARTPRATGSR